MFINTLKKFRVFWGEHPNISLALCSEFLLRVKKLIEGPGRMVDLKFLLNNLLNSRFSQLTNS